MRLTVEKAAAATIHAASPASARVKARKACFASPEKIHPVFKKEKGSPSVSASITTELMPQVSSFFEGRSDFFWRTEAAARLSRCGVCRDRGTKCTSTPKLVATRSNVATVSRYIACCQHMRSTSEGAVKFIDSSIHRFGPMSVQAEQPKTITRCASCGN